jgi:hypothetical protein
MTNWTIIKDDKMGSLDPTLYLTASPFFIAPHKTIKAEASVRHCDVLAYTYNIVMLAGNFCIEPQAQLSGFLRLV